MKEKMIVALITVLCISTVCTCAFAAITADEVFSVASTNLLPSKTATFVASTKTEQSYICVTACSLYKKISNTWYYICALPIPADVETNTSLFGAYQDYSSYIGTGTYRVYTTFEADGHSISRYSNERTF